MKRSVLFLLIIIVATLICLFFYLRMQFRPTVTLSQDSGPLSPKRVLVVKLEAPRTALKSLTVTVKQGDRTTDVLVKDYATGAHTARESINLSGAGLNDGPFELRVKVKDSSIYRIAAAVKQAYAFTYDGKPLVVTVLDSVIGISRGGAGLVVYKISKDVEKTGIVIGDRFFPGYRQGGDLFACLFPYPYNMTPENYTPRVVAVDRTGAEQQVAISRHLLAKSFTTDRINLTDAFLEKVAAEFKDKYPQATSPMAIFLKANSELRREDSETLSNYGRRTSPTPLWQGAFLRLPGAASLGAFAQDRTYLYHGQKVDRQTHLGIDLASLARAQVPAANSGKVIHAGKLGLYGNCVVIDHGLGLQTLYGHMSLISVKVGDNVEKGRIIGNTGATGMAGGDHLHYAMILSGQAVNPMEWWDQTWIRNNITGKLESLKTPAPK
jgi:murein DD-endopeptidase MepM/ murein hydrolase activator NlpD